MLKISHKNITQEIYFYEKKIKNMMKYSSIYLFIYYYYYYYFIFWNRILKFYFN
jgi:hypothetical protein